MPRFATLCLMLIVSACVGTGCQTSEGYKRGVIRAYPVVADRLEKRYDLSDTQRQDVQRLREVSADKNAVTYDDARPAWENVAPFYRELVAVDTTMIPQLKRAWLQTADALDRLQAAEERYQSSLGTGTEPALSVPAAP